MQTPTRAALMGKTRFSLVQMLRMMGADAGANETKESIIQRILLFQRQEFREDKKPVKAEIKPVEAKELTSRLLPYLNGGMKLKIEDNTWEISFEDRKDSGTLSMPIEAIVRCAKYLMREAA